MNFGKKISILRKEVGLSQQEAAQKLGIVPPVLSRYEKGNVTPSIDMIKKIADIYNVSIDYLTSENGKSKTVKDRKLLDRMVQIEQLNENEKEHILFTIDAMLRDAQTRKAYSN